MIKRIAIFILGFVIIFSPIFLVRAAGEVQFRGLVPICNTQVDTVNGGFKDPCDFAMVIALINKLISFVLFTLATPLFALILVYVGWLYLSDQGSAENKNKAKKILKNAFLGYIIALAAWIIVKFILWAVDYNGDSFLS